MTRRVVTDSFHPTLRFQEDSFMAEARAGLSFKDVRASVKRMQTEGEKLVARLQRDARTLTTRSRRDLTSLLGDAGRLQTDLRKRAEKAFKELETRRTRILATVEEQVTRAVETVVDRINVASKDEGAQLHKRVADLERRLDPLAKERGAA